MRHKSTYMFKVVCGGCGRLRYWDNIKEFSPDTCPECTSKDITQTKVEVTE